MSRWDAEVGSCCRADLLADSAGLLELAWSGSAVLACFVLCRRIAVLVCSRGTLKRFTPSKTALRGKDTTLVGERAAVPLPSSRLALMGIFLVFQIMNRLRSVSHMHDFENSGLNGVTLLLHVAEFVVSHVSQDKRMPCRKARRPNRGFRPDKRELPGNESLLQLLLVLVPSRDPNDRHRLEEGSATPETFERFSTSKRHDACPAKRAQPTGRVDVHEMSVNVSCFDEIDVSLAK